jgi:hypothetical protein
MLLPAFCVIYMNSDTTFFMESEISWEEIWLIREGEGEILWRERNALLHRTTADSTGPESDDKFVRKYWCS